jgi:HEPN domain-containing protein
MKNEAKIWLEYAAENLKSSTVLLENSLFNPCLQNAQQCVEKAIKAILIEKDVAVKRTHDIFELKLLLDRNNVFVNISEEECDILNTIYLPSKYPLGNALPYFVPDQKICNEIIEIAKRVYLEINNQIST